MIEASEETEARAEALRAIRTHILGAVFTLAGLGLVFVYSASAIRALGFGWEMFFVHKQVQWLAYGLVALAVASWLDYRWLRRLWLPILGLCLGLLGIVLVPGIGSPRNGAYRWLEIGGYNMQPSELAKLGLIIVVAALLARPGPGRLPFWRGFLPLAALIAVACGLIAVAPDFGTAALVAVVLGAMLLAGGARLWHLALLALALTPPVSYYGLTHFDHIQRRVNAWWIGSTTGTGYHAFMSQVTLGSGGTTGMGLGQGVAKLHYLPEAHTDFIFAILGQELGLAGTLFVVCLFAFLVWEGRRLVTYAPDRFGSLLAFGIVFWLGLQAAFNIAVVTATIPPKGISLPFISFGGSGLCVAFAAVGILVSITRSRTGAAVVSSSPAVDQRTCRVDLLG